LFFFDRYWHRGARWYADYFGAAPSEAVCGDVSPSYMTSADVPERIAELIPPAKIVFILRNPVSRAVSHYHHLVSKGDTRLPFESAVEAFPSIISDGMFNSHIDAFTRTFGEGAVRTLILEKVSVDPHGLRPLFEFLGVDPSFVPASYGQLKNERRSPRGYVIARLSARFSRRLHSLGLHSVVRAAKNIGLDRIVFSRSAMPTSPIPESVLRRLRQAYRLDAAALGERLSLDLVALWGLADS
jgi:hypothetical protein